MTAVETMIVGAGPYGLSIASHLRAAKNEFRIIGRAMESWRRHMPAGMMLKSEAFASNLSDPQQQYTYESFLSERGAAFHRSGVPVPLSDFLDYADWFIQRTKPNVEDKILQCLRTTGDGFELVMTDGEVTLAKRVILAIGHLAFRQIPPVLNKLPDALVSHSADHHNFTKFSNREVTVIGGGQSSLEIAALLHEQGTQVRVLVRKPIVDWNPVLPATPSLLWRIRHPESGLGPGYRSFLYSEYPRLFSLLPADLRMRTFILAAGPSGAWWLKDRVVSKFPVLSSHEVVEAVEKNGKLQLSVQTRDGITQFTTDHVIAGTGYNIDLERLSFIDTKLRSEIKSYSGAPILNSAFESSVPNLHFVGLTSAPSFGPILRFVHGTKHPALVFSRHFRRRAA
jgi:FAD-dependent urate hydroxylase